MLLNEVKRFFAALSLTLFSFVSSSDAQSSSTCLERKNTYISYCSEQSADSCSDKLKTFCCECEEAWKKRFSFCGGGAPFPQDPTPTPDNVVGDETPTPTPTPLPTSSPNPSPNPLPPNDIFNSGCSKGTDCSTQPLLPYGCGEVNGFLKQTNTVVLANRLSKPLQFEVTFRDPTGIENKLPIFELKTLERRDINAQLLGLKSDSYGTVCVRVNTTENGAWTGGIWTLKPHVKKNRKDSQLYDFALFYQFKNPITGVSIAPLNTNHYFVPKKVLVANWIRLSDATPGDGKPLTGSLRFFSNKGRLISSKPVLIADGGRFDYSGHQGLWRKRNESVHGFAIFTPDAQSPYYYFSTARYYYECTSECPAVFTAYSVHPSRLSQSGAQSGVSALPGIIGTTLGQNLLEANNPNPSKQSVTLASVTGKKTTKKGLTVPPNGTTILAGKEGKKAASTSPLLSTTSTKLVLTGLELNVDSGKKLQKAFSPPVSTPSNQTQILQYSSERGQKNTLVISNPGAKTTNVKVTLVSQNTAIISRATISIPARTSKKVDLKAPANSIGIIQLQPNMPISAYNLVSRGGDYSVPVSGY